jgi:tRNA-Thr(GGU) m(6)t(6)A37 methyltransferase TsaA
VDITYHPIGIVHSPFSELEGMPIQPTGHASAPGRIEVFPEFREGLRDLDGFSHVILLYHMHGVGRVSLTVTPFLGDQPHGVFATRAPARPNPIGLSIVELTGVEEGLLHLANLDILDGTPVLDIKPYVPGFDKPRHVRTGWLETARGRVRSVRSDGRFA